MAYVEREITIVGPGGSIHTFNQHPSSSSQWSSHYTTDNYNSDPLESVDRARMERGDFYRRVENTSRNLNVSDSNERATSPSRTLLDMVDGAGDVMVREKSISDGGPSIDSLPRAPEPHTSWRFYTSYDNGEWRRHAVPVYHSEEEVMSTSPSKVGRLRTESHSGDFSSIVSGALSPTFGLETSIKRMRIGRPSVYETLQNRRRRNHEGIRRIQGPRSPEMILNTSEYLPPEEAKRRYEVKDYIPKRRTEYGERVIYPRVKSGSISGIESESLMPFSSSQKTRDESNFEEVTRTMHPSNLARPGISMEMEAVPANSKPINEYGFQEKVIVPTKYRTNMNQSQTTSASARTSADNAGSRNEPSQQFIRQSRNQIDYSNSHPLSRSGGTKFIQDDQPPPRGGGATFTHERIMEPKVSVIPRFESGVRNRNFSRSLDDDAFEMHQSRVGKGPEVISQNWASPRRPRDKGTNQEREVKVVLVKNEQPGRHATSSSKHEDVQKNEVVGYNRERQDGEVSGKSSTPKKSSRGDELAAHVRSSTLDTMKQMENQMLEQMKSKCPEAAEVVSSLMSGAETGDVTMEKKEAFGEQVRLWQDGRPIEEKENRETRYRSNDPISGPQDFVERSSISRGDKEMSEFISPFAYPKTESRRSTQIVKETPRREDYVDRGREYTDGYSRTHEYSHYPGTDSQGSSVFYPSGYSSRSADNWGMPVGLLSGDSSHHYQQSQHRGRNEFVYAPEKSAETGEKIIIPTKYAKKSQLTNDDSGSNTSKIRSTAQGESKVGNTRQASFDSGPSRKEEDLSRYAAFVSNQLDSSVFDKNIDILDGKFSTAPSGSETVTRTRIATQKSQPTGVTQVMRLGSVHGEGPSGEWEFDMAVSDIPRI